MVLSGRKYIPVLLLSQPPPPHFCLHVRFSQLYFASKPCAETSFIPLHLQHITDITDLLLTLPLLSTSSNPPASCCTRFSSRSLLLVLRSFLGTSLSTSRSGCSSG
mmetsp:Transcript_34925/g.78975  ORF Transcript_34925/g.78975 Transcript_34925/m.78975 type:complete len:106 (-) Transcript_34925:733-1050(-)